MKVLVAVDGSRYADEILTEVMYRLWPKNTLLYLITTVEPSTDYDANQQFLHQAQTILGERIRLVRAHVDDTVQVDGEIIEGSATSMITKAAHDCGADLIIIGSHGDTGIRRNEIGSVAAEVVNHAPCSVEVVKLYQKLYESPAPTEMMCP